MKASSGVQAVSRDRSVGTALHTCKIFDCFTLAQPVLTLTEITNALGLRKSSVYRLLKTLETTGYIEFRPKGKQYALGARLSAVADVFSQSTSLAWIARPFLEDLRAKTSESTAIQLREGKSRYCLVEYATLHHISLNLRGQERFPVTTGASGAVLRAFASDWKTARDHVELGRIRAAGFAVRRGDLAAGAIGIYVPVFARDDQLIATIGIQGPEYRFTERVEQRCIQLLLAAAADLKPLLDSNLHASA